MALKIVGAVPPPAINKGGIKHPPNVLIPKHKQCYSYERGVGSKAYVLKPLIDYLTITVPISAINCTLDAEDHQGLLLTGLASYLQSETSPNWVNFNKPDLPSHLKHQYKHYKVSARLADMPGMAAIQVGPSNKSHFFLRITIVPSEWEADHVTKFWTQLERLASIPNFKEWIMKHGRIRRVDYAIDILNVDASDLLLCKPGSSRKSFAYFGAEGGVESWYIGSNGAKVSSKGSRAYLYDKKAQLQAVQKPAQFSDLLHARCEFRFAPPSSSKHHLSLSTLANPSAMHKNRFEPYAITDFFAATPDVGAQHWHLFGDSCRIRGFDQAVDMVPEGDRAAYGKAYMLATDTCWRPDVLWSMAKDHAKFLIG